MGYLISLFNLSISLRHCILMELASLVLRPICPEIPPPKTNSVFAALTMTSLLCKE